MTDIEIVPLSPTERDPWLPLRILATLVLILAIGCVLRRRRGAFVRPPRNVLSALADLGKKAR